MRNCFPKRPSGAPLHTLSKFYDVPIGLITPPPYFEAVNGFIFGRRRVAVARYRMICLVLLNSHLFPLPCWAGSAVPREKIDLSVIILASLLVYPMLGCRHCLLRHSNISRFYQVEGTYSYISTCEHLLVGGHYLLFLALSIKVVLQGHLFVDHFYFYFLFYYRFWPYYQILEVSIQHCNGCC